MEQLEALIQTGRAALKAGSYEQALAIFSQAIALAPKNATLLSERGVVNFHLNRKQEALLDLNVAAELEPNNPYRYSSRAYIKDSLGDIKGAVEDYKKAILLDPTDAVAHNNLGLLEEKLGYKEAAEKRFKKADELAEAFMKAEREEFGYTEEEQLALNAEARDVELTQMTSLDISENQPNESIVDSPSTPSLGKLISETFTTKSGLKEYFNFIRNGFKL